mmetsp:Transcript_92809/g.289364  ORF Transcript_92809/g.289364 Transcript_92809/m.289364 type:complete len:528 (+) Transcript_92809:233-1816(+)
MVRRRREQAEGDRRGVCRVQLHPRQGHRRAVRRDAPRLPAAPQRSGQTHHGSLRRLGAGLHCVVVCRDPARRAGQEDDEELLLDPLRHRPRAAADRAALREVHPPPLRHDGQRRRRHEDDHCRHCARQRERLPLHHELHDGLEAGLPEEGHDGRLRPSHEHAAGAYQHLLQHRCHGRDGVQPERRPEPRRKGDLCGQDPQGPGHGERRRQEPLQHAHAGLLLHRPHHGDDHGGLGALPLEHLPHEDDLHLEVLSGLPAEGPQGVLALGSRRTRLLPLPLGREGLRALGGPRVRQLRGPDRDADDLLRPPLLRLAVHPQDVPWHAHVVRLRVHLLQVHAPAVPQDLHVHHEAPGLLQQHHVGHAALGHRLRLGVLGLPRRYLGQGIHRAPVRPVHRGHLRGKLPTLVFGVQIPGRPLQNQGGERRECGQDRRGAQHNHVLQLVQHERALCAEVQVLLPGREQQEHRREAERASACLRDGSGPGPHVRGRKTGPLRDARAAQARVPPRERLSRVRDLVRDDAPRHGPHL